VPRLRPRLALALLAVAGASASIFISGVAGASGGSTTTTTTPPYTTGRANAGTPNSSVVIYGKDGQIISYGNSAITYNAPTANLNGMTEQQFIDLGHALYSQNCAGCHGVGANGVPPQGATTGAGTTTGYPPLINLGSATVDFWITSGRMPAANPANVQASRLPTRLTNQQALEVAAWISSISAQPNIPFIPQVHVDGASVSDGAALFALNCAACHTITGGGDALAFTTFSSALRHIPAFQVAEAIRTGPGNMPKFSGNLSDQQVRDVVAYVTQYIEHPTNPGGLGLGELGPVAEGFVGLALGVGVLALLAFWVGDRQ
jgi:ubiquinol-cytochrome c reductase cytochrome c subunit